MDTRPRRECPGVPDRRSFSEWSKALQIGLTEELPGSAAHRRMTPRPRSVRALQHSRESAVDAAVVAIFFPRGNHDDFVVQRDARLLLTLRPAGPGRHSGQVCLPGGVVDAGETFREAAWREAEEEVGVPRSRLVDLGALSPVFVPVSGYLVHPFVGVLLEPPSWRPEPREVARVLELPIGRLHSREYRSRTHRREGVDVFVPFLPVDGEEVWGATAMMLAELAEVLTRVTVGPGAGPTVGPSEPPLA